MSEETDSDRERAWLNRPVPAFPAARAEFAGSSIPNSADCLRCHHGGDWIHDASMCYPKTAIPAPSPERVVLRTVADFDREAEKLQDRAMQLKMLVTSPNFRRAALREKAMAYRAAKAIKKQAKALRKARKIFDREGRA